MSKRALLNIALLALLGVLILLVLFEPGRTPEPQRPTLTQLSRDAIHHIDVVQNGEPAMEFERTNDGWQMTQPITVATDEFRLNSLLKMLQTPLINRFAANNLDDYGLEQPSLSIRFNDTTIHFGDTTPMNQQRYLQVGNDIVVVKDTQYYALAGGFTNFIAKKLLPEGPIDALVLPTVTLTLTDNGWHVDPKPDNYSADAAAALIEAWRISRAIEVREMAARGETITITQKDRTPLVFDVVNENDETWLVRNDIGIGYLIPDSSVESLTRLDIPEPMPEPLDISAGDEQEK